MGNWIPWTSDMLIHVDEIDRQHQELFRMFNDLADAAWDGKGAEALGSMLDFLVQYTVEHFADEEAYMIAHEYPDYENHKLVHDDFVREVGQLVKQYEAGEMSSSLVMELVNKLGDWTRHHIRDVDQKLGAYLAARTNARP